MSLFISTFVLLFFFGLLVGSLRYLRDVQRAKEFRALVREARRILEEES